MKKILPALMVGALAVTLVIPSFAETATSNEITKGRRGFEFHQKAVKARGVNQEQLMELVQKYAPELQDDFQVIENNIKNNRKIPQLDEATKEKLIEIREKVKAGTYTQEQAREEMEGLGLKVPGLKTPMDKGPRMELDEATKEKLIEIREKVKAGSYTQEQAKEELEELGLKAPGLRVPMDKGPRMELDEATKEKLIEIREKVKAGNLTQEEAREEMEALGIKAPMLKMGERNKLNDSLHSKLQQAVEANDEAQIKDLLNELLIKLQNKTNQ